MQTHTYKSVSIEGFHKLSFTEWGDPYNEKVVICVHGLTRNGRDFDWLAKELSKEYRVICPDLVGRGKSDWLKTTAGYSFPQYINDCTTLLAYIRAEQVDWIGFSLGGLIGMVIASMDNTPIQRLIIDDAGPFISMQTFEYIAQYSQASPSFKSVDKAKDYLKTLYKDFLAHDFPEYWDHMAKHSTYLNKEGEIKLTCDPQVALGLTGGIKTDINLWGYWDKIRCPMMVLRGKNSTILPEAVLNEMQTRQPDLTVHEFDKIGHAPSLAEKDQIVLIKKWLNNTPIPAEGN